MLGELNLNSKKVPVLIKTLLNCCHPLKCFVYEKASRTLIKGKEAIVVKIVPRKNSKPICSGCNKARTCYDCTKSTRRFQFIPIWGFQVYFLYLMRRVNCSTCGIRVESVPWAQGKNRLTQAYQCFLAQWAKRLSWKETAEAFHTSWDNVFNSVKMVVKYGLKNRNLDDITAIGVDEWQWGIGHKYVTLVYQIDEGRRRLLYIARKRTVKSLLGFFLMLGHTFLSIFIRFFLFIITVIMAEL